MSTETQQPGPKPAEPQKEHRWLQKFVGEWTVEETGMGPDQASSKVWGTESVRSIGGLWIVAEGRGKLPDGSSATAILTLGYDPQKKRFVGTFITSVMTHLWVYESGELDQAERVLTLHAEGPGMAPGAAMSKYRDVIAFESDDHRVMTSYVLGADGQWTQIMTAHYRRK